MKENDSGAVHQVELLSGAQAIRLEEGDVVAILVEPDNVDDFQKTLSFATTQYPALEKIPFLVFPNTVQIGVIKGESSRD